MFISLNIFIVTIAILTTLNAQVLFPPLLIIDYLKVSNINLCYFFTCWKVYENLQLIQLMTKINVRYAFAQSNGTINFFLAEKPITSYAYFIDLTCNSFSEVLSNNLNEYSLRMTHPWLIFVPSDNQQYFDNIFQNVYLRLDSDVKIIAPSEQSDSFVVWAAYNFGFHLKKKAIFTKIGTASTSNLTLFDNQTFFTQRRIMTGLTLRAGSVTLFSDPTKTFEENMFDTRLPLDTLSKFHYPMFLLLEQFHNFTHTLQIDKKWFGDYQNGTDGGLGKLLYGNEIDITCTGASQRPPRIDAYDYLMPSYHFRPCFIFRNPGTYKLFSNVFLTPFSENVWYVILGSLVLICLLLKTFYKIEGKLYSLSKNWSWATAILVTISPVLNQGVWTYPTSYAGRLLYVVLLLLAILLYNYYTSSVLYSLLSKPPQAFRTLDELGHSKLEMGVENVPYVITWFNIINDSDVQYIYKHKIFPLGAKSLNFLTAEEGMEKVRKGGFAYHTQLDTGYPIVAKTFDQNAICDITNIPMIPQVFAGIMVRKKSQYKELFHIALRMMKQAGLIHRITKIWESDKPLCLSAVRVVAVGIEQTFMAFLALFLGIIVSIFLLVIEIFWFKFNFDNCKNYSEFRKNIVSSSET